MGRRKNISTEILKIGNNPHYTNPMLAELGNLIPRIMRLRGHFRVHLPENVTLFKARVDELNCEKKTEDMLNHGYFFNLAVILSRTEEPVTMGEISRALSAPYSTATRVVDWFVRSGYAERLPDPDDRRIVRVILTEEGRKVYTAISATTMQRVDTLLARFTPDEQSDLLHLLTKLATILEEEDESEKAGKNES
jgi:DNA-binding MarR family transcriptional regulator